jgi:hypothetical protein
VAAGVSLSQACTPCDAGFYCQTPGLTLSLITVCPAGSYCGSGLSQAIGCPAGTYNKLTGQSSVTSCIACPRGFYCLNAGTSQLSSCPQNYYCPVGTSDYLPYPCPAVLCIALFPPSDLIDFLTSGLVRGYHWVLFGLAMYKLHFG